MAHLTESTANQRFYGNSAAHYKVPRALKSVANSKSAVHYKVPRALKSVANSKSVSNRGTVHYENSAAKVEVDFTRSRSRTESYEVPEYNKGWRKEINEQSDNLSEDYIVPSIKPQTLNSQTVSSAASHQSHGPPVQSEGSASAAASKGATMLASSSVRKLVFFVTVFGVIFIGIIALVLGALTMKEKICYGSCSSDGVDSEEILSMRQQFASIQERFKELKGTALSTINSTTFSTVVNTSQLYEGCATNTSRCTVLPVSDDFRAFPQGPVCTTGSLRIDREVSYCLYNSYLLAACKTCCSLTVVNLALLFWSHVL